jgi:hypothetical protein
VLSSASLSRGITQRLCHGRVDDVGVLVIWILVFGFWSCGWGRDILYSEVWFVGLFVP